MTLNPKAVQFLAACADDVAHNQAGYAQAVPTPCMSVCMMDDALGLCQGCLRTLDEIAQWGDSDEALRREVWARIGARAAQHASESPSP
jgi:hypothetical protein